MQYHIPKEQNYQMESALQDITLTLLNVLQDVTTEKSGQTLSHRQHDTLV